jgi:hypothetical protein
VEIGKKHFVPSLSPWVYAMTPVSLSISSDTWRPLLGLELQTLLDLHHSPYRDPTARPRPSQ